jgi:hypothetical protein
MKTKICSQCGKRKTLDCFWKENRALDGKTSACKNCCNQSARRYYRKCRRENLGQLRKKGRIAAALWRERNPERHKQNCLNYTKTLKLKTLQHYSSKIPKCKCCGEKIIEFLAIDHLNGGGGGERRKHGSGSKFYFYLKKHNYPPGYQVLCHNCNMAKGFWGVCPHKKGRKIKKLT